MDELEYIHIHKTGKLLKFSVVAGAIMAEANPRILQDLSAFAHHLGLAFQIQDDILDLVGNQQKIGKPVGSDTVNQKVPIPNYCP